MKAFKRKAIFSTVLILAITLLSLPVSGQRKTNASVGLISVQLYQDSLLVRYDIENCKKNELFAVSPKIFTSEGITMQPGLLTGDVGLGVTGGKSKKIVWDIKADNIYFNETICVGLTVSRWEQPKYAKTMSRALLFPGWGNFRMKWKKGILFRGGLGYGGLLTGLYFRQKAFWKYLEYLRSSDAGNRPILYDKAIQKRNISRGFLLGTASIWFIELTLTAINTALEKKRYKRLNGRIDKNSRIFDPF